MKDLGKIVKIGQDEYDDGIQELVLTFDSGEKVLQKREWPDVKYRGGEVDSLHELVYYSDEFRALEKSNPDAAFGLICRCSKLVDGPDLKPTNVALEDFTKHDVEVLQKDVFYEDWFKVVKASLHYRLFEGGWSETHDHLFIEGKAGVACVLYDVNKDRLLLIQEFRIGAVYENSPWMIGIVTGALEDGEDPEAGAKREAMEEAGAEPYCMIPMLSYKVAPGFTTHHEHIYLGLINSDEVESVMNGLDTEGEDIKAGLVRASDIPAMIRDGKITNGTALQGLQHFLLFKDELLGQYKGVK